MTKRAVPKAALLGTSAGNYYEKVNPGGFLGQLMDADKAKKQQKADAPKSA